MTLTPGHFPEVQRKILREVALTYRRARRAGKGQNEAVDAAIAEYRRLVGVGHSSGKSAYVRRPVLGGRVNR
jgi:hypothetical protein